MWWWWRWWCLCVCGCDLRWDRTGRPPPDQYLSPRRTCSPTTAFAPKPAAGSSPIWPQPAACRTRPTNATVAAVGRVSARRKAACQAVGSVPAGAPYCPPVGQKSLEWWSPGAGRPACLFIWFPHALQTTTARLSATAQPAAAGRTPHAAPPAQSLAAVGSAAAALSCPSSAAEVQPAESK